MLFPYLSSVCRCTILRIVAMVLGIAMEELQPGGLLISMVLLTNLVPPLHSMGLMHAAGARYLASQRTPYLYIDTSPLPASFRICLPSSPSSWCILYGLERLATLTTILQDIFTGLPNHDQKGEGRNSPMAKSICPPQRGPHPSTRPSPRSLRTRFRPSPKAMY